MRYARILRNVTVAAMCCWRVVMGEETRAPEPRTIGSIERLDASFDQLVSPDARLEVLAEGFEWSEGPVWQASSKTLLFSDIPRNHIVAWNAEQGIRVFREAAGYTGQEKFAGAEPGTNGLVFDAQGRLVMCCHGDRLIRRLEADGTVTTLADRYQGKRFNSPNDLVYRAQGDLYFTDPPYGLPGGLEGPHAELPWCGVYRLTPEGSVTLLTKSMSRPNGIGFSPDEKTLYVAQSDPQAALWMAFPVREEGTLGEGRVFYDATRWVGERPGLPDGLAVDTLGNVWATGPGGVLVFSPAGRLLGRLNTGQATANCTFGEDGKTLFITADMYLCRIRTQVTGMN
ncbi:MAG: SMP-30/gluconolactonase/LRE family protein [Pirellulaceae bacterium]